MVVVMAVGLVSPARGQSPEIELLIDDTSTIAEITPFNVLPNTSVRLSVHRVNGQWADPRDVAVVWHCPAGKIEAISPLEIRWTAPRHHGMFPMDLVIQWKALTLTRRVTLLVLIPMESHAKGRAWAAHQRKVDKEKKRVDQENGEDPEEGWVGMPLASIGLNGLQSLKYYAETLPSRLKAMKPRSRIYARREYYLNIPKGLIEVTPENEHLYLTPHYRLKDFKCKGEKGTSQYICLDPALLMKLEAIQDELNDLKIPCDRLTIMSGYRTPPYNRRLGNVKFSRHTYGDAADIYVDQDGDGRMDDLNKDGKINIQDAQMLRTVIERVEDRGAPLGGIGVYPPKKGRGPFVHVDTRGFRARW